MSKEPDNELRALYTYVRAGINPDNGELHITEDEFIKRIEARVDAKVKEAIMLQKQIDLEQLEVEHTLYNFPMHYVEGKKFSLEKQIEILSPTNPKREEG